MSITIPSSDTPNQGSFILSERARQYYWQGEGLLSIKTFRGGPVVYHTSQTSYRLGENQSQSYRSPVDRHLIEPVPDHRYLLLNHAQPYAIEIDTQQPVRSFCIFFAPGYAASALRDMQRETRQVLDDPHPIPTAQVNFFERTYPMDDILQRSLRRIEGALGEPGRHPLMWFEEQLQGLMGRLLALHRGALYEAMEIPGLRLSTRLELYRRLHLARDYALANYSQPLRLDELARVAGLSVNHFLRTFKTVFHQTPHQFLTDLRLARAYRLLAGSRCSVTEACFAVGFESLGSFSALFRRRFGFPPSAIPVFR